MRCCIPKYWPDNSGCISLDVGHRFGRCLGASVSVPLTASKLRQYNSEISFLQYSDLVRLIAYSASFPKMWQGGTYPEGKVITLLSRVSYTDKMSSFRDLDKASEEFDTFQSYCESYPNSVMRFIQRNKKKKDTKENDTRMKKLLNIFILIMLIWIIILSKPNFNKFVVTMRLLL